MKSLGDIGMGGNSVVEDKRDRCHGGSTSEREGYDAVGGARGELRSSFLPLWAKAFYRADAILHTSAADEIHGFQLQ